MSIQGEIRTLYSDREQTQAVFPRTKMSAVSDENGVGLNVRLKNAAPRNLLDNSDFRNPVNQRGQTSYVGDTYAIDRWYSRNAKNIFTVGDGFIRFQTTGAGVFRQYLEHGDKYINKKMTAAVKFVDGSIYCASGTMVGGDTMVMVSEADCGNCFLDLYRLNSTVAVQIYAEDGDVSIEWMALYEGEYTAETLPEYQPKGYGAELAECMRYYWPMAGLYQAYGHGNEYGSFAADIVLPVEMRVNPTVSYTLRSFIINGEDKKSTLNRVDVECSTKRLRFSPVTLIASDKNKIMRMAVSDIKLSADL